MPSSEDCNDLDAGIMSTSTSADGCCASYQLIQEEDADGIARGSGDTIRDYVYDASGLLESETRDDDADNTADSPLPIPTMPTIVLHNG